MNTSAINKENQFVALVFYNRECREMLKIPNKLIANVLNILYL